MAQKCVHQGCGKLFTDPDEACHYHPGPPVFHEGQKGWKCCKPRVLTFDEFLEIKPCTQAKHSTTDLPPQIEKKTGDQSQASPSPSPAPPASASPASNPARKAVAAQAAPSPPPPPPESEDDDPSLEIPDGKTCRRKACNATYKKDQARADDEKCVHHPGAPIFHEGAKGYSCCKRRVLEFDQFMKIEGCKTSPRHLFIGTGKDKRAAAGAAKSAGGEELLDTVRSDFYQSPTTVIASYFLKKIVSDKAVVEFQEQALVVDLPTSDAVPKRYKASIPLFGPIDPAKSTFKIFGTKLEVNLHKADGSSWPALRSDERVTGGIYQLGAAGRV